jgi:hypothetical protein
MKLKFDDRDLVLIWLYVEIDQLFAQTELPLYTERLSNNAHPNFTDAELFTCAIFAELMKCIDRKTGYSYLKHHYHEWFKLPGYEVYNRKLNKYHEALTYIFSALQAKYGQADQPFAIIDTEPIEVCQPQHSRRAKAAKPFVSKGYCPAKKKYYVGAKLQIIAQGRSHMLPFPAEYYVATASLHDLDIAKETLPDSDLEFIDVYADLAYPDADFECALYENKGIVLKMGNKKQKGQEQLTLFQQAENAIHSSIRQPVDTLFGWIDSQTRIQQASKVRSVTGLFLHIHLKMLAALILLIIEF